MTAGRARRRAGGWRQRAATVAGRVSGAATRRLGRGGGTALPGVVAQAIDPGLTGDLAGSLGHGVVTVTGTNGKTTTAHLLTAIAQAAGWHPLGNRSGSNMERGVLAALLAEADAAGRVRGGAERLAVLEVDEAALPALLPRLRPRAALFLNLFRDQLDRYGEVHRIAAAWHRMLRNDASGMTLVLNVDDPSIAELADRARGDVVTFGVEDPAVAGAALAHGADARFSAAGHRYRYDHVYLGHLGAWTCPEEGRSRPPRTVAARDLRLGAEGTDFTLAVAAAPGRAAVALPVHLPLAGLYSVYNALAAVAGAVALGIDPAVGARALAEGTPAFGRQERFALRGRDVRLWLAKNPTGLSEVLRTLRTATGPAAGPADAASGAGCHLLVMLNDGVQDGRDVSWIYDADVEQLAGRVAMLVAGGARAADLALRWHLAGVDAAVVESHTATALDAALERTPPGGRLDIVATYTAMLEVRAAAAATAGMAPYWADPGAAAEVAS